MTVTRLWVHPRGDRRVELKLDELPDGNLLHLFHTFAGGVTPTQLLKPSNESYASVEAIEPVGQSLTLAVEVGRYGERGSITDTKTMKPKGKFGTDDALSVVTHGVLTLPRRGTSALAFLERSNNQCGVIRLIELFKEAFQLAYPQLMLETTPVVESEAWLKHADLIRVSAFRHRKDHDISDNSALTRQQPKLLGELAHTLVPPRGAKLLPRWIYDRLVGGTLSAGELLGFSQDDEDATETEVTLKYGGKSKTFLLGRERRPSVSYPLSDHNEESLTSEQIRRFVFREEMASDLYDRLGLEWTVRDTVGRWTDEQLRAKMVARDDEQS
ncbi:hypothetical protein [Mycobacteroides abscessus]|uniref:hypothetical protein n=1 Tax=Mycobacteroides abscessus TaxID=36809 RepID=UPI002103D4D1|nr:hypothetical protein [Mycobacteroides abscessus]